MLCRILPTGIPELMLMAIEEEKELPRLYSRAPRCPADIVAPQHRDIHAELERWGSWNAERYRAGASGSVESRYREQTPKGMESVDLKLIDLERAVLRLPVPQRDTVRMFYVTREDARTICRIFSLRYEAFPAWMYAARHLVLHNLRVVRHEVQGGA